MKIKSLLLSIIAIAFVACNENENDSPAAPDAGNYNGVVTVTYQGQNVDNNDISVDYTPSEDGKTADITIHKIKFVPQMPVTIDVTIPSIEVSATKDGATLSCASVVPLAMGGEYPRYTVTDFTGSIKGDDMQFSLNFGDYPTVFKGKKLN